MEHEPDKYDNMYTGYLFHPISVMDHKNIFGRRLCCGDFFLLQPGAKTSA